MALFIQEWSILLGDDVSCTSTLEIAHIMSPTFSLFSGVFIPYSWDYEGLDMECCSETKHCSQKFWCTNTDSSWALYAVIYTVHWFRQKTGFWTGMSWNRVYFFLRRVSETQLPGEWFLLKHMYQMWRILLQVSCYPCLVMEMQL